MRFFLEVSMRLDPMVMGTAGLLGVLIAAGCTAVGGTGAGAGGSGAGGGGGSPGVDECALGTATCDPNATCTDTPDAYTCTCNLGFSGDGKTCVPVGSCTEGQTTCTDAQTVSKCMGGTYQPIATCMAPAEQCQNGACVPCGTISFTIDTQQACAMSVLPGFQLDGEGFIQISGTDYRVFGLDRWGSGHVVAWCDSTTLPQLFAAFDLKGYLGQVPQPKVAAFGDQYLCKPGGIPSNPLPAWITYLGMDLPATYQGNAAQLAADWDVLVLCGFRIPWTYDFSAEIGEFVTKHGKGFLAVMDYEGAVKQPDFDAMNKIVAPAGIHFEPLNLPWTPSSTNIALDCVPDVPPVPK